MDYETFLQAYANNKIKYSIIMFSPSTADFSAFDRLNADMPMDYRIAFASVVFLNVPFLTIPFLLCFVLHSWTPLLLLFAFGSFYNSVKDLGKLCVFNCATRSEDFYNYVTSQGIMTVHNRD
jgi:hypothetical protein